MDWSTDNTDNGLWIGLRITDYGLGLRTTDYGLRTTDYGHRTTDTGLRTADYGCITFICILGAYWQVYPPQSTLTLILYREVGSINTFSELFADYSV